MALWGSGAGEADLHFDLTDIYRDRESPVHRRDPRVKLLGALLFILATVSLPDGAWMAYGLLLLVALAGAGLTRLGPFFAVRRAYVALPFMLAALPIPFLSPGPVVWQLPILGWPISEPGLVRFVSILIRTWLAVQAGILLSATTRLPDLLWALGALRLPATLVNIIGFMVRYIFVLMDEAARMLRARAARSPRLEGKPRAPILWQGQMAGAMVGSLFLRSLERSERVYDAMLSRGYSGRMRMLSPFSMSAKDWAALLLAISILAIPLAMAWTR